jgi:uncharacterized membrane protein
VPIIELRGAVPLGVTMSVNPFLALAISVIGNMIPVPFIFLFARRVLEWGKDVKLISKFCKWVLKKGEKGGKKLTEKAGQSVYLALVLFVGIPIPGTGAWTGTLAASLLDLDHKKTTIAVLCGIALAGAIMLTLSLLGLAALG